MIENMDYDDDFEDYGFEILPIVAALFGFGRNPYAGKNSWINRSGRARKQRRDPGGKDGGQFIEQGGMGGFNVRFPDGKVRRVLGQYIGETGTDSKTSKPIFYVLDDPSGLDNGFYVVEGDNFDIYDGPVLADIPKGTKLPEITGPEARKAQDSSSLQKLDAPVGWLRNDDGSYTTDDGEYTITPPSEGGDNWELSRKDTKYSDHEGLSDALKRVSELDRRDGLSQEEADQVQDLLNEEVRLEEEVQKEGPAADAARDVLIETNDAINKILAGVKAPERAQADSSEPADDSQAPKAKKQAAVGVEDTRANTPGNLETRWGKQLGPAMMKAQNAIQRFMAQNKANNRPANTKEISDLFDAIDKAFLDANNNPMRYDADVDAFQELSKEFFGLDSDIARARSRGDDKLVADLQGRKKEVGTQVTALQKVINTRLQERAPLADEPTVDVSTNFPETTDFVPPTYAKKRGKGRPKGTGKLQQAAKQAEEQQKVAEVPAADEAPTPTPAGPTPEERKAEAEAQKAEAEARKAQAEADKAEAEVEVAPTPAPAQAAKQGQVADAPETGTTKTGTRSRVQNAKELNDAPVGTVVHRFSGNGTFDDSAFGTVGRDLLGEPSYTDSIIKGEDGQWYKISPKTGNPESKPVNTQALRLNANDTYGSSMVFDTPDDGSTPETMYAQAAKGKADAEAARSQRQQPAPVVEPEAVTETTETTETVEGLTDKYGSDVPEGWSERVENTVQNFYADDDRFKVTPGGKFTPGRGMSEGYSLVDSQTSRVERFKSWDEVEARVAEIKSSEEGRAQATAARQENNEIIQQITDGATPQDRAKAAVNAYDDEQGTIAQMIDDGATSEQVLAKLNEISPEWDVDVQDYLTRSMVDSPSAAQKELWETHENRINAINELSEPETDESVEVVALDVNGDIKAQIEQAIADGNDVSFYYQGSGDAPTLRTVTPDSVWTNPQTGQDNLYGLQQGEDKKKNFTISKMSNAPAEAPEEVVEAVEPVTPETTPQDATPAADEQIDEAAESETEEQKTGTTELESDVADAPTTEAEVKEANAIEPTADETAEEAGANLELITTRTTDEDYADEAYLPTEEQRNVIDATVSELDVAVQALAGSGKTSTLVLASKQMLKYHPDKKILYIAFNKTVQLEAGERMPKENTEARTGDSLAWWGVSAEMRKKIGKGHALPRDVADDLGIPTSDKEREDIAMDTMRVIEKFSISDSPEITQEHFDAAGVAFNDKNLAYAQMAWADLNDPNGNIKYTFTHNTKIWALSEPDLSEFYGGGKGSFKKADVIFFDEAQDINPVMAKVIRDQNIQKIYVGDSNQAIYGFRGADNELDKVETDITLPMTRTFRFGQTLAGPGNRMLSLLNSPYKIIGAGKTDGEVVEADSMNDADAVLTRTNGGRFAAIIEELAKGRVVGILKNDKADAEAMIATVKYLQGDGNKPYNFHEDLDGYKTWKQVEIDVNRGKASGKVEMIYNIVSQYPTSQLSSILSRVVVLPEKGDNAVDPSTLSALSLNDGASGEFLPKITYSVSDNGDGTKTLSIKGFGTFAIKDSLIKPNGFRWDANSKSWAITGTDDDVTSAANKVRGTEATEAPEVDVLVLTAHKSKGLEWGRVRIGSDFRGPEPDDNGDLIFPDKQELNLAYVALTRAENAIDPGTLAWVYDYTSEDDEDPTVPSKGLPEGVFQNGIKVEAPREIEEVVDTTPAEEDVVEEEVTEPVGADTNPVTPAPAESGEVVEEVDLDALDEETAEEVVAGPAPAEKKTNAPLTTNEDQSNLDPAPAETTDTGVEGVSNDPQDIADTYDNKDLKDALVTAVQNDEPGINIEGENGNTAVVPVENVRDALQKQGTNTNDLIDEAVGASGESESAPAEVLAAPDSASSTDALKRFNLNHLLRTREVPAENKDAIDQISLNKDATDEQLDWAIGVLSDQPDLLTVKGAELPTVSDDIITAKITDPGQIIDAIESVYPESKTLSATGDLIVHSEIYMDKATKTNFRYELGVVRTSNELFYVYARETNLSTGQTRSRRVSPFTHSAKALNNDIIDARLEMLAPQAKKAKNLTLWFGKPNSKAHSPYIQDEAQISLSDGVVEPIHRREEPIHRDLVEAIKASVSDQDISDQVVEGIYRHIAQYGVSPESLRKLQTSEDIDEATFSKIIDTLNAHVSVKYKVRTYGTYVSDDSRTPVDDGDLVIHTHERTRVQRLGRVIRRQGTHWTKGYGYTDYLEFRPIVGVNPDGTEKLGKGSSVTSKNLTIRQTAQGTDGSERQAALRDYINQPLSIPAVDAPERKAPMQPAQAPQTVDIDRSEPTQPTVTVEEQVVPAAANRTTNISEYTPTDIDAAQLKAGDYIMTMDPDLGLPRLAEIVSTSTNEDDTVFTVNAIIPNSDDTAKSFTQSWDVNQGISGMRMIAYRKPAPEPDFATDDSVQELLRSLRAHDISFLDAETAMDVNDFTTRYVGGENFSQEEIDNLLGKLAETPLRIATPTPAPVAVQAAQDIVDGDSDTGDATALQDVANEALVKVSEIDNVSDASTPQKLTGYTVLQNERGVYYPDKNILRGSDDFGRLRRGEVLPPALPFVLVNTPNGDVTYYDGNGERRWGQFGAAGAVLRTKNDDGTYSYFLAKRTATTTTDPNKWSVPGGAHDSLIDAQEMGVTAKREMAEELGIDVSTAKTAGNIKKELAPDWAYDYTVLEVDKSATDNLDMSSGEVADTGWFTAEQIRGMFERGELHSGFDSELLENIFNVGDAPEDEASAPEVIQDSTALNLNGFEKVGGQGGSNPGGTYRSPEGIDYYVKFQRSDMHAGNEVAAAALYNKAGVTAPAIGHGTMEGKSNVTHSGIVERTSDTPLNSPELRKKVQEGFAIDAWLANWDAVLNDNTISDKEGNPVRVDVGGSLLFRAQGSPKRERFGDVVGEIDSLRDPRMNSTSTAVYGSMTNDEIKESARKLLNISEEDIDSIVDESFGNVSPSNKLTVDALKATLKARRKNILDRFGLSESDTPDTDAPTPTEAVSEQVEEVTPEFDVDSIQLGDVIPNSAKVFQEMVDKDTRYNSRELSIYANGGAIVVGRSIFGDGRWKLVGRNYVAGENIAVPDGVAIDGYLSSEDLQKLFDLNLKNEEAAGRTNYGVIAGDIRDNVRDQSTISSVYGGVIPTIAFELGATRYSSGTTINNGTETYRVSSDPNTLSSTFTNVRTDETFSGKEMASKVASGQEFRFGKLAQDMTTGDDISPEWLKIAEPGQSIFLTETSRYLDNDYDRVTTLTLGEDGIWRDVFGRPMDADALEKRVAKTYSPTGSYSYMSAVTRIGTSGIPEADLPNLVRSNDSSLVSRFSSKVYTNGKETIAAAPTESRDTGSTPTWYRVTNPDGTPYRGPKSLPDNVVKERISYEEVEEFFRGPISTDPRNVASVGQTINKDNVDALDTLLTGANVRVKTTLPMDGEPLELDVDMVYDGSTFITSSGFALSKDAVESSLKKNEGTVTLLDKAEKSGSGTKASSAQVSDFESFLSKKLGSAGKEYTERFAPEEMSAQQINDATQYIEDNGIAERELAKAVLLYSSKFNDLPESERAAYANAAGTVYSSGSSRKNRSLGEVFSQLDDAIEKSADKGEGREQSSSKMEVLVNLFPELQAKPKVVPSQDKLDTSEGANLIIYRGNRPTRINGKNVRASTLQKDWAFGERPFWGGDVGGHAYGHGMYYSDQIGTARSYAGLGWSSSGDQGRILAAQMNPDAKILTTDEGSRSKRESIEELQSAGYIWYLSYLMSRGFVPGTDEFNAQMNKGKKYILDQSFTPALRGYDVLKVYRGNEHFWIVVNRGAMTVVDPTPKRGRN